MQPTPDSHGLTYSVEANDPDSVLINRAALSQSDMTEINQIMMALGRLRDIERKASEASQRYMELNETDMRALHYLILAENRGETVTAGTLARHLAITTASVTKMLDRLSDGGHILRRAHPNDRRAITIVITPETRTAAMGTVGRFQAARFQAAAGLNSADRHIIIQYLLATAEDLENSLHLLDRPTTE